MLVAVGLIAALLLLLLAASGLAFWRYPLATLAWVHRRQLTMSGLQRTVLPSSAGPQTFFQGGSGPAVVLLHGAGDQAGTWSEVIPRLAGSYRILALDLPGHGASAPEAGPLTMETILAGIEAVLATATPPFTLVGNSLGAWVAMLYARRHPDRVARLVLIDGGPLRGDRPELTALPATRQQAARMMDAVLDPATPRPPGFILDDVARQFQRGPASRLSLPDMQQYLFQSLEQFPVPVDLLWGESDRLVPLEYGKRMQAQLPAARLTVIPKCGHIPQQECPTAFVAALEAILRSSPPARRPAEAARTVAAP